VLSTAKSIAIVLGIGPDDSGDTLCSGSTPEVGNLFATARKSDRTTLTRETLTV
jgi:hypothetical protein